MQNNQVDAKVLDAIAATEAANFVENLKRQLSQISSPRVKELIYLKLYEWLQNEDDSPMVVEADLLHYLQDTLKLNRSQADKYAEWLESVGWTAESKLVREAAFPE